MTATIAEIVAKECELPVAGVRRVLDILDRVTERALLAGHEVEIGSMGYLSLREPVANKPPKGEVTRGKRVAFREKNSNRHRWR